MSNLKFNIKSDCYHHQLTSVLTLSGDIYMWADLKIDKAPKKIDLGFNNRVLLYDICGISVRGVWEKIFVALLDEECICIIHKYWDYVESR